MDDVQTQNPAQLRDQLVARLRAVEAQIESLQRERETLHSDLVVTDQFINVWRRTQSVQGPLQPVLLRYPTVIMPPALPTRRPRNPPREFVVDVALEVIRERGMPVPRGLLYEELERRGIVLHGKDPVMVFSTMLWRSQERVVRLPNFGYWPAERTYEPAGYFPQMGDVLQAASREPEDGVIEDDDDDTEVSS